MRYPTTSQSGEIKKLKLEEVVLFAINNIPQVDPTTLKQLLELTNAGGTFGTISYEQILKKMRQVLKYVPGACVSSLVILTDLLEIEPSDNLLTLSAPQAGWFRSDNGENESMAIFMEPSKSVLSGSDGVYIAR